MKRLNLFYGATALAAALMAATFSADAQENGNRDEFGRIVRGPYETNAFEDNWFIGAGGGINILLNEGYDIKIGPSVDVNFGKWFTPSVGMRAGYQGLNFNSLKDNENEKFGYMYFHGDFLWNISNAFSGYKETRFWNFVPYLHAGFFRSYTTEGDEFSKNEFAAGTGLLHNLRLSDRLDIIIDMRATVVEGTIHRSSGVAILPSVTAGLAVDLGWPNFMRTSSLIGMLEAAEAEKTAVMEAAIIALEAANASLEAESSSLRKLNKELGKTVKNLQDAEQGALETTYTDMQPITVYFPIGKAVLDDMELKHLDFYASNIIGKVDMDPNIEIVILGSADSNTGTAQRNKYLSEARGKYIMNLLSEKYGIGGDRVIVKNEIVKAKSNPAMDRAAIITFK
jgi:outer membrane protein OmpA-like peptidoglycan-associated protein